MKLKINSPELRNLPWQERPADSLETVWRYTENPIIGRRGTPTSNSIFNSAAVPYKDGFAGVFRVDNRRREMHLHFGFSSDGIHWDINPEPFTAEPEDPEAGTLIFGYDPRCCFLEDRYYITWCNCKNGPTIGIGYKRGSASKRISAVQPQRGAVPAQNQRQIRHAEPSKRQRPYPVRRHLLQRKSGSAPLGLSPPCHESKLRMAGDQNRSGPHPDRNIRRLADLLPWSPDLMQRLPLQFRRRPAGSGTPLEGDRQNKLLPARTAGTV